jgi:Ca-activated chloride channel family protein
MTVLLRLIAVLGVLYIASVFAMYLPSTHTQSRGILPFNKDDSNQVRTPPRRDANAREQSKPEVDLVNANDAVAYAPAEYVQDYHQLLSGSFVFRETNAQGFRLSPVLDTQVEITVTGMIARTKLTQTFSNPSEEWINGIYVFPLPEDAAVDHLNLQVGERVIEGQIQLKAQAKKTYERAKQQGKKASLVAQQRPNLFTNSVANIAPGETVKISIEYQQLLAYQQGLFSMRFPMTVGPRYIPGRKIEKQVRELASSGWAFDTDEVSDASRITPPIKHPAAKANKVNMQIQLNVGFALNNIKSEFHPVTVVDQAHNLYQVSLKDQALADHDFVLSWQPQIGKEPRAAVFSQSTDDAHFGLLMLMPPVVTTEGPIRISREVTFILDTSGSMAGDSILQAKAALKLAIEQLSNQDSFNVIEFNSQASALWPSALAASIANKVRATDFIHSLEANGGTEMAAALTLAFNSKHTEQESQNTLQQIVFITDGSVGNEEALMQLITARLGQSRLFTIGIGSAPNSYFMGEAARVGKGSFTYIGASAQVQEKMHALLAQLTQPALTDIGIDLTGAGTSTSEFYPAILADLYAGQPLLVSYRSDAAIDSISVSGKLAHSTWNTDLTATVTKQSKGIDVLWARRKISQLTQDRRAANSTQEQALLNQLISHTALTHHLVSEFTSLVAVDLTPSRPTGVKASDRAVPNHLPQGWQAEKVFGQLPQTATSAQLQIMSSLILMGLALCLRLRSKKRT